jgi:integrase
MGRSLHKLNARAVATLKKPGRHGDGGGLYLWISNDGRRRWVFLFNNGGKLREMGLGSPQDVSLGEAREKAAAARKLRSEGLDPLNERRNSKPAVPTFGELAERFVSEMEPQFRNAKHVAQWRMTLKRYAAPLAQKAVSTVTTEDVLCVLRPIWHEKNETASRLRGRIERVLDAAKAQGHRSGENPARWRGHLDHLLPRRQRLQRGHHAAMPFGEVPAFVHKLRGREAVAARALEFLILTAARTGEVLGATWQEINFDERLWTVPAQRMKAGREHRVPLSDRALAILSEMALLEDATGYVFPSTSRSRPLSPMAMDMLLRRMKLDVTERAYRRGDALEKRRALMSEWASFCAELRGEVVHLKIPAA